MARILYVDDERAIGQAVKSWLARGGTEVRRAHSCRAARGCLARFRFDGVFIDVWLGDGTGFDLYDHIHERYPALAARVVFVTGDTVPREDVARRIADAGCPVLPKPFDLVDLETWVAVWAAAAARDGRQGTAVRGSSTGEGPRFGGVPRR